MAGGGSYLFNDQCIITATPAQGWTFTKWIVGSTDVTQATYKFTVTGDVQCTAYFAQRMVTVAAENDGGGQAYVNEGSTPSGAAVVASIPEGGTATPVAPPAAEDKAVHLFKRKGEPPNAAVLLKIILDNIGKTT